MSSAPDIQASLENADEIAELTGRSKSDIIADLLDDGKLNNSNAIKENTTALDKATEMAGKTHKLLTAIIPILILLAGSGLELGGIIDLTPVVFCDVTAVIAVIAYDPSTVTVLISACIPAPPDESDPAIIKILDFGFNLFNFSCNNIYTSR